MNLKFNMHHNKEKFWPALQMDDDLEEEQQRRPARLAVVASDERADAGGVNMFC